MLKSYGICVGAANITIVSLCFEQDASYVIKTFQVSHEGNIFGHLENELRKIKQSGDKYIAITGRKIKDSVNLPWISEPEAVEESLSFVNQGKNGFDAVISMGAEVFIAYLLSKEGHISSVRTLNKCASGTGEFFMQQLRRMNIPLDYAIKSTSKENIYRLSSRCSVFCKSDCTHALNKGQDVGEILAGLSEMMARKVLELLVNTPKNRIMLIGSVALNPHVVRLLRADIKEIHVPKEAHYFEALGASLWGLKNKAEIPGHNLIKSRALLIKSPILTPLSSALNLVDYKPDWAKEHYAEGDVCILGLDVGSTTTKAVMLRERDNAVLDSVYLRTNGNPIAAACACYKSLADNLDKKIKIIGLGTTGSGRQITALHALSDGIVNEIIAHSRAAVYFDPEVDTIFEIGGQDAKYTHITNGVCSDYAMNEACSAGTGSFLEESCKETLGVELSEIEHYALKSKNPPNFNDQCAAFISSDIKAACQDGLGKEDIIAGLVYSICVNYNNRVKGNRIVGNKIFMQGGVCYNKAVPLAFASILGKKIIIPPQPGLMGAFGVALEVKNKLKAGILKEKIFNLNELADRKVCHKGFFKCNGNKACDRKCDIARMEILGQTYLFGGSCNKYYNLSYDLKFDSEKVNLVKKRQECLFSPSAGITEKPSPAAGARFFHRPPVGVGINKSFLTHILFPLYYNFFTALGCRVIIPDKISDEGVQLKGASFCYPAEIAHGLFHDLLQYCPDYIFLPQILELKSKNAGRVRKEQQSTCVILQGESYYLRSSFKGVNKDKILAPVLDFSKGLNKPRAQFLHMAQTIGFSRKAANKAYKFACEKQHDFTRKIKHFGLACLEELKQHPDRIAVVLLGRAYNAFSFEANMAIPDKFASRGITVIPFDCLPYEGESDDRHMYWATGQMLLKASRFIKKHPQLFGTFITNFSCGPDSFIVGNVREIMGKKPMLILEIDSHTADAGINTRIEAFLDIINGVRSMRHGAVDEKKEKFHPARCINFKRKIWVTSSDRERFMIDDRKVKVLVPAMGELGPQALASVFRSIGINSVSLLPSDDISLKYGRANTTCKECLPLILTAGGLLRYFKEEPSGGNVYVYFMPATGGNCRFGQYNVFLKNLIRKQKIKNLAVWSMDTQNSYTGLGARFNKLVLRAAVISDVMYDIKNAIKVLALDRGKAIGIFDSEWKKILHSLAHKGIDLELQLGKTARALSGIPLKYPLKQAKVVALMGEIYVRRDDFCCNAIIERLSQKGFIVKTAPVLEWLHYVDYLVKRKIIESNFSVRGKIEFFFKQRLQRRYEKTIKEILSLSGLYRDDSVEIEEIIHFGKHLVSEQLTGESIVVVGAALKEIMHSACGVINVGPFACLPSRIIEAILSSNMNLKTKMEIEGRPKVNYEDNHEFAFLSIEVDGNPFPLLMDAKIEAFCLQAERLHHRLQNHR